MSFLEFGDRSKMTVKAVKESGRGSSESDSEKLREVLVADGARKKDCDYRMWTEEVDDQESGGSSEEFESPKSVAKVRKWTKNIACVHSQVLRIREEDLHLGEDMGKVFSAKDKVSSRHVVVSGHHHHVASHMDVVLLSRPILPSSPLSRKTPFRS